MEKNVEISLLCEIYGKLLTKKQYDVLNDFSLSEIAENLGITRQAVRGNLKKGENKLFEFEEKLEIMKIRAVQEKKIVEILSEVTKIQTKFSDEQIANILENIKKELNCLV